MPSGSLLQELLWVPDYTAEIAVMKYVNPPSDRYRYGRTNCYRITHSIMRLPMDRIILRNDAERLRRL